MPFVKNFWKKGYASRIGTMATAAMASRIVAVGNAEVSTPASCPELFAMNKMLLFISFKIIEPS